MGVALSAAREHERQFAQRAAEASAELRVSRDGELAQVRVETGSVRITFRGHDVMVGPHHAWSAQAPTDVVDDRSPRGE